MAGPIDELFNQPAAKVRRRPKWRLEGLEGVQPLTRRELRRLISSLPPPIPDAWRDAEPASRLRLGFYPGYELCEIRIHETHTKGTFWILNDREIHLLDGTNRVFYSLNSEIPIQLTDENVLFYLRVFFRFVRGRHGDFHFMESLDDVPGLHELDSGQRIAVEAQVAPLRVRASSNRDGWTVDACLLFKEALFTAPIEVAPDGKVNLGDSTLQVEGIHWSGE